ncbi:MAG: aminotransferase class I/II-fold pyridoxal phosphate-dependent enzyme [Candidatus Eisenbacteria bacterium]|uniref:Aminotransferase n=1 Tax=Eiseniibacteriota bacterium TaxID=2212470 RepID=A0A7Y2E577_UNCEI|nr:aminotransferase class I/II-fold pyridoxal phosphate-dependent enzyme [Candidatus Eisenbacteria bacterium]
MASSKTPSIHLNLNVRGLKQSATLRINEESNNLLRSGHRVFKLGLGQSPFPVPTPVVDELKVNAHQKDYLPVMGLRELRGAVADFHNRTQHERFSPDGVMIGPGSKELMFILQLVYYGDLVIPTPSWVSYAPQAHIVGRHIRWLPTSVDDGWRLTPERLHKLCSDDPDRPRLFILNYPSNPTGMTYKAEELRAIATTARKYRVLFLSDEIYGELHHRGQHISIGRYYPEGTIISSGLSKWCGAGGWRLGTFTFPEELNWLKDAMGVVASETYTSTSAPIQYAAVRAFQSDIVIEEYLWNIRRILRRLGRVLAQRLSDAGVRISEPQGGFYLFPDFSPFREDLKERGIETSEEFCRRLLKETGVAALPGSDFGHSEDALTVRLAYVDFDGTRALVAAEQIPPQKSLDDGFLEMYCHNCLEGIDRICNWIQG